jgi:hypothetical protein
MLIPHIIGLELFSAKAASVPQFDFYELCIHHSLRFISSTVLAQMSWFPTKIA